MSTAPPRERSGGVSDWMKRDDDGRSPGSESRPERQPPPKLRV
jgi:hypothetical protein